MIQFKVRHFISLKFYGMHLKYINLYWLAHSLNIKGKRIRNVLLTQIYVKETYIEEIQIFLGHTVGEAVEIFVNV